LVVDRLAALAGHQLSLATGCSLASHLAMLGPQAARGSHSRSALGLALL